VASFDLERCELRIKRLVSVAVFVPASVGLVLWEVGAVWPIARAALVAVLIATGLCLSLYVRHQVRRISRLYVDTLLPRAQRPPHRTGTPLETEPPRPCGRPLISSARFGRHPKRSTHSLE